MEEIGAYSRYRRRKTPYAPVEGAKGGDLFIAPNEMTFNALAKRLFKE